MLQRFHEPTKWKGETKACLIVGFHTLVESFDATPNVKVDKAIAKLTGASNSPPLIPDKQSAI